MKKKRQTIIFTGGHYNSALEVAKLARKRGCKIVWLGHKYNLSNPKIISNEYREVKREGILFEHLTTGRFYKKISIKQIFLIFYGFIQSIYYLIKHKPDLIYSSGGFMAVPVIVSGYFMGIPGVTHEQTVISGWANKAISPFVKRIFLTYKDIYNQYPKQKTSLVGLPLNSFLTVHGRSKKKHKKTIFVTTGKQGSSIINSAFFPLVNDLIEGNYQVVHQIGSDRKTKPNIQAHKIKSKLGKKSINYIYSDYFFAKDQARYLQQADLVVSRSGAHTVYELVSLNKNAILIPIPWVSHQEQLKNALYAQKEIGCTVMNEVDLTPENLYKQVKHSLSKNTQKLPKAIKNNAAEKILTELEDMGLL